MLLYLLSALFQNTPQPAYPPSPPAPPAPPAPPIYAGSSRIPHAMRQIERFAVDVEILGAGAVLWSGPLRLASGQPASVRHDVREASSPGCDTSARGFWSSDQSSLSLSLSVLSAESVDDSVRVALRWGRPVPGACGEGSGSARAVELNQSVQLERGKWVVLNGDAGLVLRLRRR